MTALHFINMFHDTITEYLNKGKFLTLNTSSDIMKTFHEFQLLKVKKNCNLANPHSKEFLHRTHFVINMFLHGQLKELACNGH